jgi:hypothetical protein
MLDDAARYTCTSRTPLPALTAPCHDMTAALSVLAAQKHEQDFGATFDATRLCMLDDATVHIEDAASCGYRAKRLDVYSTTHRCVEWPCFTEAKSVPPSRDYTEEEMKGPRKGPRKDVPTQVQIARPPAREHRGQREQRRTRPWKLRAPVELLGTDCADCARRSGGRDASGEVKRPP